MPGIASIPPEILRTRHRLSPLQINILFGRNIIEESRDDKAVALERVAGFLELTDALTRAGVGFIPLKGPLLSERLYGDPTARYSHDLDILVREEDIANAYRVLAASGYIPLSPPLPESSGRRKKKLKYNHHISYIHPDREQIVELHWRIMNRPWMGFSNIDGLLQDNLIEHEFAGRRFIVPAVELELLYLVIHGAAHRWGRLKWLADVHRLLEAKAFSETGFSDLTKILKAGRLVALCNEVLMEYFPKVKLLPCSARPSEYMLRSVRRAIASESYHGPATIAEILNNIRYALSAYPGLGYKLKLAGTVIGNSLLSGRLSRVLD